MLADDTYYACPSCSAVYSKMNLMSGNTFGAIYYSDCKREAPHMPDTPRITECTVCHEIFWLDASTIVEESDVDLQKVHEAAFLSIDGYTKALRMHMCRNSNQIIDLRLRLLWAYHDEYRAGRIRHEDLRSNRAYSDNIEELMTGLDREDPGEGLLLAELYRFIGMYAVSMKISKPFLGETDYCVADTSYDLASKQVSAPFRIVRS